MAETIKGINVVIGSETTGLQASLKDVNKCSRDVQSELRQVEKLLKLDPTNTELVAQKQKLLSNAISNSKEKLNSLKAAQEQVNAQFQKGEISEGQYRAFQREVAKAEQELNKFEGRLKETSKAAKNLETDIKGVGDNLKGVGQGLSMGVTAPLIAGFALVTQGTKELRGDLATLATNAEVAGQDMDILNDAMVKLSAITGEADSNVEGLSELMATGFRDEQLTEILDSLYGASIKFKDTMKFEGIADGLQETLATGAAIGPFGELLERSGINLDEFNRGLTVAIANHRQENYILKTLAKTGLADTYEAYRKNNEEMIKAEEANFRMQQALARLGATLEPLLTPLIEGVTELVNKFNDMSPAWQKIVLIIAGISVALGPLLVVISSAITVFGTITTALTAAGGAAGIFATAITFLTGPIGIAVTAIAALIAVGVLVYKNWDAISASLINIWQKIKDTGVNVWDGLKAFFEEWGKKILLVMVGPAGWAVLLAEKLGVRWDGIKEKAVDVWNSITDFIKKWGKNILMIAAGPAGWITLLAEKLGISWEDIKATAEEIWEGIKTSLEEVWAKIKENAEAAWDEIKTAITKPVTDAKTEILELVEDMENAFANMKIKIPKPKLPHISVTEDTNGTADYGINWYGSGGIFSSPSIIGVGEAGTEAVLPLERLPGILADALKQAAGNIGAISTGGGDTIVLNVNMSEIDEVYKLVNVVKQAKQTRRAGFVGV